MPRQVVVRFKLRPAASHTSMWLIDVLICAGNLMQIWVMALAFAAIAPIILPFTLLWCAYAASVASTWSQRPGALCLNL